MNELKRKSCVGRQLYYLDYLFGFGTKELPYSRGGCCRPGSGHLGVGGAFWLGVGRLELSGAFPTSSRLACSVGLGFASSTAVGLLGGSRVTGDGSSSGGGTRGSFFRHSLLG